MLPGCASCVAAVLLAVCAVARGDDTPRLWNGTFIPTEDFHDGPPVIKTERPFLVVSPTGDASQLFLSWLDDEEHRCFDVVALYFGETEGWECPQCVAIVHQNRTGKWHAYHLLYVSELWPLISDKYDAFMLPDDDLIMSTHVINVAFWTMSILGLELAQPSVCNHRDSHSIHKVVMKQPGLGLRYTAFVEIMGNLASKRVMNEILMPNLYESYTGYGLDFVWPRILEYPPDKIAIIDAVCMFHPKFQDPSRPRVYDVKHPLGWHPTKEDRQMKKKYKVTRSFFKSKNVSHPRFHIWRKVSLEEFREQLGPLPECGGGQVSSRRADQMIGGLLEARRTIRYISNEYTIPQLLAVAEFLTIGGLVVWLKRRGVGQRGKTPRT